MKRSSQKNGLSRRVFFRLAATTGIASGFASLWPLHARSQEVQKPPTNVADALKYPRNKRSMPGRYPGTVVRVTHEQSVQGDTISSQAACAMLEKGILDLTGSRNLKSAWRIFVSPGEKIGLKVNPIGGRALSTSHEVVRAVISQLEQAGIRKQDLFIWDRREFQLHEAGFTAENYPGITIVGTEKKDPEGSYYDRDGLLYSEKMIDKDWYYWADVEGEYDAYTLPYMVNGGKYSYFTNICTRMVDKIINIPVMKNAGASATLCLKNLAYGAISNTGRLHAGLWAETCAEVNAFPPLRDKVVLNILDGIRGCFDGGPGANPQFFTQYKSLLLGTDPVAVDRIGYEMILRKRLEEKRQTEESPNGRLFLELAANLGLGVADMGKIDLREHKLT